MAKTKKPKKRKSPLAHRVRKIIRRRNARRAR
jgi:hypothetical protein